MAMFRNSLALAAALSLTGCLSFGSEPPESLLTLTPERVIPAGASATGTSATAIRLLPIEAPVRLNVTRIPVQVTDTKVAYLKDAVWVEKPARLFRRLMAETIRTRGDRLVIDGDDPGVIASDTLRGTLREFGYDAPTSSVVVRFDAVRINAEGTVVSRRFESTQPGVIAEAGDVGAALNRGANDVAGQIADWISAP